MSAMASQITSLTIVYSTVYSGTDKRIHQSSASLAFVRGIHRWPVNSPHKGQWRGKCFHLMTSSCRIALGAPIHMHDVESLLNKQMHWEVAVPFACKSFAVICWLLTPIELHSQSLKAACLTSVAIFSRFILTRTHQIWIDSTKNYWNTFDTRTFVWQCIVYESEFELPKDTRFQPSRTNSVVSISTVFWIKFAAPHCIW